MKKAVKQPIGSAHVVRKCHDCGGQLIGTRQAYVYTECGLKNVTLLGVMVFECSCGVRIAEIPAISELHCVIALGLLMKPSRLSGVEVRYLRKMSGLSQKELAKFMGVDATRPSKWERRGMGNESDRLLRAICVLGMIQNYASDDSAGIKEFAGQLRACLKDIEEKDNNPKPLECRIISNASEHVWSLPGVDSSALVVV